MNRPFDWRCYSPKEALYAEMAWRDGATAKEIAAKLGRSEKSVLQYAHTHRDKFPLKQKLHVSITDERIEWMRTLRSEGYTISEIARIADVSRATAGRYTRGVEINH